MSMRQTIIGTLALVAIIAAFTTTRVSAQTCGDANGNHTVTVTDGVQALRLAAGLSSSCEDGCDVDGSGVVTVSDGVNILRKAAGLAINEACNFTGQEANGVVTPSLSIFDGITKVPGFGSANAFAAAAAAGDCENDGTIERVQFNTQSATTFTNCEIGGAVLDGTIGRVVLGQGVALGFDGFMITRLKTGESHTFMGQLAITAEQLGKRVNGMLTVVSSERGTFMLEFQRILLTGDGSVRQGALMYDLTKTTGGKIAMIQITFNDSDALPASVQLRNQQVKQFLLNRGTGLLVPAV
jgi:hypothetical protein